MKTLLSILLLCLTLIDGSAPDLKMISQEGDLITLDQYEGQVVYLSFWASWCGPCKANFKKYQSMRAELEELGVVILNVSIDREITKWHEALGQYSYITGVNTRALNIKKVMDDYNLSKVPDYHIIDKNGNFVYLSDKLGRDIVAEFKVWVDE